MSFTLKSNSLRNEALCSDYDYDDLDQIIMINEIFE